MKVAKYLQQMLQFPIATRDDLTHGAPFVILSPHPDDETLGLGGLIKQACMAGQQVDVVVLTDGSGSHPKSVEFPVPRLIHLRKEEMLEAAKILGLPSSSIHHFDLRDTQAPTVGPGFEAAARDLASVIKARGAKTLFTTWRQDPHCDHEAAAAIADAAIKMTRGVKLWAYPIWAWHLDPDLDLPEVPHGYRIEIAGERDAKRRAISAHRSQMSNLIEDDPTGFRFTEETLAPFLGRYEYVHELAS